MTDPENVSQAGAAEADVADLRAAAGGDRDGLARLYDRHAPQLMALGIRMLGERREAEDILHDVMVEAWRHADAYDPTRATVKTWLILRMRSRCLDHLRSAGVARRESMTGREEAMLQRAAGAGPGAGAGAGSEGGAADRTPDARRAVRALAALPEEQRQVIVLGFFDGLSSSEIADELGIPIGTVKSRVRSAMGRLRTILGEVA